MEDKENKGRKRSFSKVDREDYEISLYGFTLDKFKGESEY